MRTRYEHDKRTGAGTRPLWTRLWGGAHIYCFVMVCESVHAVWITYFGVAIYILVGRSISLFSDSLYHSRFRLTDKYKSMTSLSHGLVTLGHICVRDLEERKSSSIIGRLTWFRVKPRTSSVKGYNPVWW